MDLLFFTDGKAPAKSLIGLAFFYQKLVGGSLALSLLFWRGLSTGCGEGNRMPQTETHGLGGWGWGRRLVYRPKSLAGHTLTPTVRAKSLFKHGGQGISNARVW